MCQFCGHEPNEVIQQVHGWERDRDAGIVLRMGQPQSDLTPEMQSVLSKLVVAFAHTETNEQNRQTGFLAELRAMFELGRSYLGALVSSNIGYHKEI